MDREGLDALLVFGEHGDAGPAPLYFDTWFSNDRPGATVLFPRDGEPVALVWLAADDLEYQQRGGGDVLWIPAERRRIGHRDGGGVAALLTEFGLSKSKIGVIGLDPYLPFLPEGGVADGLWTTVVARLPDADFRQVGSSFARAIMPQSDEELAVVRHCALIGEAMARAMVGAAGVGVPENEVYAAGMNAAYLGGTVAPLLHM